MREPAMSAARTPFDRLVVLGFDGMDFELTRSLMERGMLPNISAIARSGHFIPLRSVFPPDSIPSWITVFSGLDPSEHGVLDHVNYLLQRGEKPVIDTSVFHGKTFWDRIGAETGSDVCIVNPFMAYPAWPVNGVMVSGPVFISGDIQVSDPSRLAGLAPPASLGGIEELPTRRNIADFLQRTVRDTDEQAQFGVELLRQRRPSLFFQTFFTSDRIQHHLWRYCDRSDPTYPGPTEVEGGIERFFMRIDAIVGEFAKQLGPRDRLIIMSDHGHGMRCTHCFNVNEYLRRRGHLKSAARGRSLHKVLIERLKNRVLRFMNDHDLEDYISKVARLVPGARAMKKGAHITSFADSSAYATDFAGTNPFGGIVVNRGQVADYDAFRDALIRELLDVKHGGEPVFRWVKPREAFYGGKHIGRYPDILYEMAPRLGTGFSLHCELVTVNPTHKKISGGHKADGIFICNALQGRSIRADKCSIANMYATFLSLYGLAAEAGRGESMLDGASR